MRRLSNNSLIRPAVINRNRPLTYHELNQAANRLAHAILAQREEKQEPIALLLEHDSPLLVAIMGVLKAGKICVVLDPSFPIARSAFLLEDSQAGLLITDRGMFPWPENTLKTGVEL